MRYDDLPALQARIIALEQENASLLAENGHLKKLLADAGIAIAPVPESPDPDQGERIIFPDAITTHMANRFFSYFWGRQDVYTRRSVKKDTGAAGYYRQCANLWRYGCHRRSRDKVQCKDCEMREDKRLTIEDVKRHLEGNAADGTDVIGIYPMLPDDTCRFIVFDFDNHTKGADAEDFANTDDAYTTPTGRVKRRKSHVGRLQGQHDNMSGVVDIAMAGSLCKKGIFHPLLQSYGMVIVDECHHAATDTMANVLQQVKARYIYGVTATPIRGDGLEKVNHMMMGPIRYRYTSKQRAQAQGIRHLV